MELSRFDMGGFKGPRELTGEKIWGKHGRVVIVVICMDPVVLAPLLYAILYGYWGVGTWNLTVVKLLVFFLSLLTLCMLSRNN